MLKDGFTIWLTGKSGVGKTTLAEHLADMLITEGYRIRLLDENQTQSAHREINPLMTGHQLDIVSVGEKALDLNNSGYTVICAMTAPNREERLKVRERIGEDFFILIHLTCQPQVQIKRSAKKQKRNIPCYENNILSETSCPYEAPDENEADLVIDTTSEAVGESLATIRKYLIKQRIIFQNIWDRDSVRMVKSTFQ